MSTSTIWKGVLPAITTPFNTDGSVDHELIARHVTWMVDEGCTGIVPHGSLGEGATLSIEEKLAVQRTCVAAVGDRVPVVPGIAALSTADAVDFAKASIDAGCKGLMVLPPYAYSTDWREMKAHVAAILKATDAPCILYNNPVAYKTDFTPENVAELAAEHQNLEGVKESSTDVRRVTGIKALTGDRLIIGVGVDDCIVEGIAAGARFWIAGLVSAFPKESVAIYNLALAGEHEKAAELYNWFLPLLRLDTVPKFVQLIKLVQTELGWGTPKVRAPRLEVVGEELEETLAVIRTALATRPD